jgi:hypothetical protein
MSGYCFECGCHINGPHKEWCSIKGYGVGFQSIKESDPFAQWCNRGAGYLFAALGLICLVGWLLSGCVIGRLDSDHLRVIPLSEVHRMDDKGFPLNLVQPKTQR